MPTYHKVKLSLSIQLLRQLERIAAQRRISVSRLVYQALEEFVTREGGYSRARDGHLAWLEQAADLGTGGVPGEPRDGLHER